MKNKRPQWVPLYITGKTCFSRQVMDALERSGLPYMPGYLVDASLTRSHCMLWVDELTTLSAYKKAIGARNIWKFRLHFFQDLNSFTSNSRSEPLPDEFFTPAS
jgi:hypothetical protein